MFKDYTNVQNAHRHGHGRFNHIAHNDIFYIDVFFNANIRLG